MTAELETLANQAGFTRVFCELVMRRSAQLPIRFHSITGLATSPWSPDTVGAFFEAYCASFSDRPGFPGWTRQQWVEHVAGDQGTRSAASMVVFDEGDRPIGFVLTGDSWIVQIGVVPSRRREGIAKRLVGHAVEHIAAGGSEEVWLNVNEDNAPAISLYEGLGFTQFGRRGRFEQTV